MLGCIRRSVGFDTRRPGYLQSLPVESWLEEGFRKFGLAGPLHLFDPHDTIDKVRVVDLVPVARFFANAIRQD